MGAPWGMASVEFLHPTPGGVERSAVGSVEDLTHTQLAKVVGLACWCRRRLGRAPTDDAAARTEPSGSQGLDRGMVTAGSENADGIDVLSIVHDSAKEFVGPPSGRVAQGAVGHEVDHVVGLGGTEIHRGTDQPLFGLSRLWGCGAVGVSPRSSAMVSRSGDQAPCGGHDGLASQVSSANHQGSEEYLGRARSGFGYALKAPTSCWCAWQEQPSRWSVSCCHPVPLLLPWSLPSLLVREQLHRRP
jgi:hypothetical protein